MMAEDPIPTPYPRRALVDASILLDVALGRAGAQAPARFQRSRKLLDDAIEGEFELLLPSSILLELTSQCDGVIGTRPRLNKREAARRKRVVDWCRASGLSMVDLTADAALWFASDTPFQVLNPGEASVLASARYAHAEVVYTWDDSFIKAVDKADRQAPCGVRVCNPPLLPAVQEDLFTAMEVAEH